MRGSPAVVILPNVGGIADARSWRVQMHVVEEVEKVAAQIEAEALGGGEGLLERPIHVEERQTADQVAWDVAESAGSVQHDRLGVEVLIDYLVAGTIPGKERIADEIGA